MSELAQMKCEVCEVGAPTLTDTQVFGFTPRVPEWKVTEREGVKRLERAFKFPDFARALAFTQRVGELAEAEGHHPTITTAWGRVNVVWYTHKIKGLHRNDFIMAARTDEAYKEAGG